MSGKRGPTLALSGSSDEDCSDHDEVANSTEDACPTSPCSSTNSGPTYVRTAGFKHHGHTFYKLHRTKQPKHKKKKHMISTESLITTSFKKKRDPLAALGGPIHRTKPKKEPLPMKLRALPQSFWQQPNAVNTASPANMFKILPPLYKQETGEDVTDVRPVTPPDETKEEKEEKLRETKEKEIKEAKDLKEAKEIKDAKEREIKDAKEREIKDAKEREMKDTKEREIKDSKEKETKEKLRIRPPLCPRPPPRIFTASTAETDLLVTLFDGIENEKKKKIIKRGRPKRVQTVENKGPLQGEDPYMIENITEGLLPMLSLENMKHSSVATHQLSMVSLREGDKSLTLPSLTVEQNYSHMLSELVNAL
ncbi:uncharacterized protein LOC100370222 [Saccoglossus kowalevskii]|uniref:E3 ubiquitin-protein ligase BRE1A-like n=1 Tax=Saccoglossus kowalevskii TaxID=10224 RepID=A0ABM0GU17_SACKO|nr:PREDICTED: E3 ubiquitin-protein ligase BRE1A-like [Saccoglossus kowalevskii]